MQVRKEMIGDISIDYSTSSVETFDALEKLRDSGSLYFKFSKNRFRFLPEHAGKEEFLMDFDLCLIDRTTGDTIIQLFAIFVLEGEAAVLKDISSLERAVNFGIELIQRQIDGQMLRDLHGNPIQLPAFEVTPESIHLFA